MLVRPNMTASWRVLTITLMFVLLAAPLDAGAQQKGEPYRIGFLGNSTAVLEANLVGPFREGLRDLGYVEGRNVVIEYRWAEGKYERFPALIGELIALKVDVIVTAGTPAALAVKKATKSVPLVMVAVGDPVATGLVASLARPSGNITGLTSIAEALEGKRLELLREVVPKISRQDPQGRQARRPPGRATDEVRHGDQPENGEVARPDDPAITTGAGGRSDSVILS